MMIVLKAVMILILTKPRATPRYQQSNEMIMVLSTKNNGNDDNNDDNPNIDFDSNNKLKTNIESWWSNDAYEY